MKQVLLRAAIFSSALALGFGTAMAQDAATPAEGADGSRQIQASDAVARVNGSEILLSDLLTAQTLLPGEAASQPFEVLFPQLLQLVIEQRLFSSAASANGIASDPGFQREVQFIVDRLLQDRFIDAVLSETITEEVLAAEIAAVTEEAGEQEQASARHILVTDKSNTALVEDLISRTQAGEDFSALASEFSEDPGSAARGGDLGTFGRGVMVPEFDTAVFSQEVGEVSAQAIETQFGLHIILVDERSSVAPDPEQIRNFAIQRLQASIVRDLGAQLREQSSIQVLDADGNLPDAPAVEASEAPAEAQ